jgi:hypothetical protein
MVQSPSRSEAARAADDVMPWWLRLYLILGTVQGMGLGLTGLIVPAEMQIPLRVTPLNARVAAAMYTAAALGLLVAAFGRRAHARILVFCFALATSLILVVTLVHWQSFMDSSLPHRPLWIGAYVVDPILAALVIPSAGFLRAGHPHGRNPLSVLFVVAAIALVIPGAVLLIAPGFASAVWPWALPPVLAQVYGGFFLAFAAAGVLAAREMHPAPVRIVTVAFFAFAVLVLLASYLHLARFAPGPRSWLWFGGFIALGLAFGTALVRDLFATMLRRRDRQPMLDDRTAMAPTAPTIGVS